MDKFHKLLFYLLILLNSLIKREKTKNFLNSGSFVLSWSPQPAKQFLRQFETFAKLCFFRWRKFWIQTGFLSYVLVCRANIP
jgi:hypothetical protein